MSEAISRFKYVKRADGTLLTPGDLPPADTQRWVMRRKADVVMAVRGGLITVQQACSRYRLTKEEFFAWQRGFEDLGLRGLSAKVVREKPKMWSADRVADQSPDAQTPGE